MVLQRSSKTAVWGRAEAEERIRINLGETSASTVADESGRWRAFLDLRQSGQGPFELIVEGKNTVKVTNVVVGDVWLASGQSNMEWELAKSAEAAEEIPRADVPLLRQFKVERAPAAEPADDVKGRWIVATPQTAGDFSAVAYFFAREIVRETGQPVGIINSTYGGTQIESWTSAEASDTEPGFAEKRRELWRRYDDYPRLKDEFVQAMNEWTAAHQRTDPGPPADIAAFIGEKVDASEWTEVQLPGAVQGPELPESGVVWLRREVEFPANGGPIILQVPVDGFEKVWFDGRLLEDSTLADFPGTGSTRRFTIEPEASDDGRHMIAIRLYQPSGPTKFPKAPNIRNLAKTVDLGGTWLAKIETTFPDLEEKARAAAPVLFAQRTPPHRLPCSLYNGMISPLRNTTLTGMIWYQGESNTGTEGVPYRETFPRLIRDWRSKWNRPDLPFYFCQLPAHKEKTQEPVQESGWANVREAQSAALTLPHTGQAVLIDLGEAGDVHPREKKEVGHRLANVALAGHYGKEVPASGPVYRSHAIEGSKVKLSFDHTADGLVARQLPETYVLTSEKNVTAPLVPPVPDSELQGFALRGDDGTWHWARAEIKDDQVIVWSEEVSTPAEIRYAWADNPTVNLFNSAGLPAAPFRAQLSGEESVSTK